MLINSEKIVSERRARAWTQQHLADVSAISLRTIQRVENNGTGSLETIKALASCFEIDVAALYVAERQSGKNDLKSKVAILVSAVMAIISSIIFITPLSLAAEVEITAETIEPSVDGSSETYRGNVEIVIPRDISLQVSADSVWGTEAAKVINGSVEINLGDSTITIDKAIIIKTENGFKITTDHASRHTGV